MSEYLFYYKFQKEKFGVLEDLEDKFKVESIESRKTYDIKKEWIQDQFEQNNLTFSKSGLAFDV